jgi:hypothetical protein
MAMTLSSSARTVSPSFAALIVSLTGLSYPISAQEQPPVDVITVNTDLVVFDTQGLLGAGVIRGVDEYVEQTGGEILVTDNNQIGRSLHV